MVDIYQRLSGIMWILHFEKIVANREALDHQEEMLN